MMHESAFPPSYTLGRCYASPGRSLTSFTAAAAMSSGRTWWLGRRENGGPAAMGRPVSQTIIVRL